MASGKNENSILYPELSYQVMGAIFEVHKELGPGFLETVYEKALVEELKYRGLNFEQQKPVELTYRNKKIGLHKIDLVIEGKIVLELKTVELFSVHHKAQLLSYLKASGHKLGILVNFSRSRIEYQRVVIR